jgi:hypothetical protein
VKCGGDSTLHGPTSGGMNAMCNKGFQFRSTLILLLYERMSRRSVSARIDSYSIGVENVVSAMSDLWKGVD